jgi:hypothetical protein
LQFHALNNIRETALANKIRDLIDIICKSLKVNWKNDRGRRV